VWRSLVARFVRDEEAVGSNPATPTKAKAQVTTPKGANVTWASAVSDELLAAMVEIEDAGAQTRRLIPPQSSTGGSVEPPENSER
jgi:hypothetical protein